MEYGGDSRRFMQSTHVNRDAIGLGSFVNNALIGHRSTFLELLKHKNKKIAVKQYWQISDKSDQRSQFSLHSQLFSSTSSDYSLIPNSTDTQMILHMEYSLKLQVIVNVSDVFFLIKKINYELAGKAYADRATRSKPQTSCSLHDK